MTSGRVLRAGRCRIRGHGEAHFLAEGAGYVRCPKPAGRDTGRGSGPGCRGDGQPVAVSPGDGGAGREAKAGRSGPLGVPVTTDPSAPLRRPVSWTRPPRPSSPSSPGTTGPLRPGWEGAMGPCGLPAMLPAGAARQTPTSARSPARRSPTSETCSRGTHRTKPGDRPVPSRDEQALAGRTPGSRRGTTCCKSNDSRHDHQRRPDRAQGRPVTVGKGVAKSACPATGPATFTS
jgi:hypothetical protein